MRGVSWGYFSGQPCGKQGDYSADGRDVLYVFMGTKRQEYVMLDPLRALIIRWIPPVTAVIYLWESIIKPLLLSWLRGYGW